MTGLAIQPALDHALAAVISRSIVLGQPWIIIAVAGVLYFLEFFADKIPWIDSAWDTVHTVIRPIGGALTRDPGPRAALGPSLDVIVVLFGGSARVSSRTPRKHPPRLVANTSPEPFLQHRASASAEDAAVLGGLALHPLQSDPGRARSSRSSGLAAFFYFAPKIFRAMRAKIWLVLQEAECGQPMYDMPSLSADRVARASFAGVFAKQNVLAETIAWAVPCVSGRGRKVPANLFGALVATNEEPRKIVFVGRKNWSPFSQVIDLEGTSVAREPQFLSEDLVIVPARAAARSIHSSFTRSRGTLVELIAEDLRTKLATVAARTHSLAPEPVGHV